MYQKQLNQQQLSCPLQRAAIRGYLNCNFWLYVVFFVLHTISVINLLRLGDHTHIYPSIGFGIVFLIGAIRSKRTEKQLDEAYVNPLFKTSVERLMCLNWVLIIINLLGFIFIVVALILISLNDQATGDKYGVWPLTAAVQVLVFIPFAFQAARHKVINQSLLELISAEHAAAASDQVSFTNEQAQPGQGYGFEEAPLP